MTSSNEGQPVEQTIPETSPGLRPLVDRDALVINPAEDLRARLHTGDIMPGYPQTSERLTMTREEIATWEAGGMDFRAVRREPSDERPEGVNTSYHHPNYVGGLAGDQQARAKQRAEGRAETGISAVVADDGERTFSPGTFPPSILPGGYDTDSRGVPVLPQPYRDAVLQEGAVVGPGYYWHEGPNPSASAVIVGLHDGVLHLMVITKEAENGDMLFVPGGMADAGEDAMALAAREAGEEAFRRDDREEEASIMRDFFTAIPLPEATRILASNRTTLNAWEESYAGLFVLRDGLDTDQVPANEGDDASTAQWVPLTEDVLERMFPAHANDVRLAVLRYQEEYGRQVMANGLVREAA